MAIFKLCYGDEEEEADVEFSDGELMVLEEFLQLARRVEECPVVQMGMPFGFKIAFEEGGNVSVGVREHHAPLRMLYSPWLRHTTAMTSPSISLLVKQGHSAVSPCVPGHGRTWNTAPLLRSNFSLLLV
jgi:hypothetical protein